MEKRFTLTIRVVQWMQIIQMLFAVLCVIAAIFALLTVIQGSIKSLIVLVLFVAFAYLGWANALSTVQITEKSITVTIFYGRFRINWDEVQKIMQRGPTIALVGNDKRLVLAMQLMDKNKNRMLKYISQQSEERNIEFVTNERVPLTQHNTRV